MNDGIKIVYILIIGTLNLLITSYIQKILLKFKYSAVFSKIQPIVYGIAGVLLLFIIIDAINIKSDIYTIIQFILLCVVHMLHTVVFIRINKKFTNNTKKENI